MRRSAVPLMITLLVSPPIAAQPHKPYLASDVDRLVDAWNSLGSKACRSAASLSISDELIDNFVEKLVTEDLSLAESLELLELTAQFRCSLSEQARRAFDALIDEAKVRRFDFKQFVRGEVELVIAKLMPSEWRALVAEAEQLHQHGIREAPHKGLPLVIGCVMAFAAGVGLIGACYTDVTDAYNACTSGWVCSPNGPTDSTCCESKSSTDMANCLFSVGQNGPDNDYGQCCL